MKAFENDSNFVINEQVEVFATPGHTLDSVSVSVKSSKGRLISVSFSVWLKSPNQAAKSLSCAILIGANLAPLFGDFSQSEKLSEIKRPLKEFMLLLETYLSVKKTLQMKVYGKRLEVRIQNSKLKTEIKC